MKNKRIYLILFLISISASAQIKGIVVDENEKPIPYVNIWVENENIGTTSEENGTFFIDVSPSKNLIFSTLGFEKKIIKSAEAKIVHLKPIALQLEEVIIAKRYETKEKEIGQVENEIYQAFDNGPRIDVKYFPYNPSYKKTKYIKKVSIFTDSKIEDATIKIHFFAVDSNGFPGVELLDKDFIVTLKKGVYIHKFDVTDFNLKMPKNGIFVGFEKLLIEKNKLERAYYPFVLYNYVERECLYTFSGGKWNRKTNQDLIDSSHKMGVYEPAINLILTN
jgi:hypothetical protein